jgi:uncharacterized protein (DUF302 family)
VDLTTYHVDGDVAETVQRLVDLIKTAGAEVFAVIDHAAGARAAGLEMPDTQVIIFGSPTAGTPLMLATPDLAIDLPLRILVRQDPDGTTRVLHHDAAAFASAYGLPADLIGPLQTPARLAARVAL